MRRQIPHEHEEPEILTLTEIFKQVTIPIFNIGLAFSMFAAFEYEIGALPGFEDQMPILMSAGFLTMLVAVCILIFLFDDMNERLTTMIRTLGFSLHTISFVASWIILLSEDIEKSWLPLLPALALLPIGTSICFRETCPPGLVCLMHLIWGGYYSTLLVDYDVGVFGFFDEKHSTIYPRLVQNRFYVVGTGFVIIAHGIFLVILAIVMKDSDGPVFNFTNIARCIYQLLVASVKLFIWVFVSFYELITKKQRTEARQQKQKEARLRHILEEQAKAKALLEQAYPINMRRKSKSDEQPKPETSQKVAEAESSEEEEKDPIGQSSSSGMTTPKNHQQAISSSESSPEVKESSPKTEESPEPKQLQMVTRSRTKETKAQLDDPDRNIRVSEERSYAPKQKRKRKSKGRSCKK